MDQNELLTDARAQEIDSGQRFQFGRNWTLFLKSLYEAQIGREPACKGAISQSPHTWSA